MRYKFVSDSHVHTDCSRDGTDPAMMMCESAARLGLYSLTITDHCECNCYRAEGYDKSIRQSCFETRKASAAFIGRLHVFSGMEIGQATQDLSAADDALGACKFDFVLASLHQVKGKKDFSDLDYSAEKIDDLLERYFDELLGIIEWGRFDSLAHLTYPWRYISGEHGIPIKREKWAGKIDEVLRLLIRKQKALELNTSGFRQKLGVPMPDFPILCRYRELGGRLITLGSDAHRWADVGGGVEQGLALLQKAGFRHFMIYASHQPKALPIN